MGLHFAQVDQWLRIRSPVSPMSPVCIDYTPLTESEGCSVEPGVMTYRDFIYGTHGTDGTLKLNQWLTVELHGTLDGTPMPERYCRRVGCRGERGAPVFRSLQEFPELGFRPGGFA